LSAGRRLLGILTLLLRVLALLGILTLLLRVLALLGILARLLVLPLRGLLGRALRRRVL
jgi:hypothetical protein